MISQHREREGAARQVCSWPAGHEIMQLLVLPGPDPGLQHLRGLPVPSISTPGALLQGDCFVSA